MDPLSISASIIAIIGLAGGIAKVCKSYIDTVKDYPKELRVIFIETSSLAIVLQGLKFLKEDDPEDASILSRLGGADGPIHGCKEAIEALSLLLPTPIATTSGKRGTKRRKIQLELNTLAWPLKAEKAKKLLENLMQFKSTISMAIGSSLLRDIQTIKKTLTESQVREVCLWFQHTDPSPRHNAAKALYENETGTWVLQSEQWSNWLALKSRCIWIHGIPGAGKTILASHLIEQVRLACDRPNGPVFGYAYYYCYHGHNQDESSPFLRWLISQICRQTHIIHDQAHALFKHGQQPSIQDLLDVLHAELEGLRNFFVIIDALDESQPRENLLKAIQVLMTDQRFRKIQLLVTSREYADIEKTMNKISDPIPMSNPLVEADIKLFVRKRIRTEPRFQIWPQSLQDEVEISLSKGAKGMFRWAVCQLDILRRLRHIDKIKAALLNLPETLDETYERIFSLIAIEDRELVRHALRWIFFHNFLWDDQYIPLSPSVLLDSYLFSKGQLRPTAGADRVFIDSNTFKESCGCLLSYTERTFHDQMTTEVTVAHYTVREFLEANRMVAPSALFFKISLEECYMEICTDIFRHALDPVRKDRAYHGNFGGLVDFDEYCFVSASKALHTCSDLLHLQLVIDLLDCSKPHYGTLCAVLQLHVFQFLDWTFVEMDWRNNDGSIQIAILTNMLQYGLFSLAHKFCQCLNKSITEEKFLFSIYCWSAACQDNRDWNFRGTIIELFAGHPSGTGKALWFLLDFFGDGVDHTRLLHLHIFNHYIEIDTDQKYGGVSLVEKLLQEGANPRPKTCQVTPLQIAVAKCDTVAVKLLLEANADANDCGDANNNEWANDEYLSCLCLLSRRSPLHILRHKELQSWECVGDPDDIEELLLRYGAEEFTIDEYDRRLTMQE